MLIFRRRHALEAIALIAGQRFLRLRSEVWNLSIEVHRFAWLVFHPLPGAIPGTAVEEEEPNDRCHGGGSEDHQTEELEDSILWPEWGASDEDSSAKPRGCCSCQAKGH